jgi:hypothetical protein
VHVELDQKRVDLVITILDVGMTYANLSDTSRFEETVRRNDANARRAYATAVRLSRKLPSNTEDWQLIRAKLALLNKRLQARAGGGGLGPSRHITSRPRATGNIIADRTEKNMRAVSRNSV